jgi:hypothetical protein
MCLHPELGLMEKGWLVQVVAEQGDMMKLRKKLRKGLIDGEEKEEVFDMEEINPPNYVDMRPLMLRAPTNLSWRVKVSYKGKTESVRENRRILTCTQPQDAYDYIFRSLF